LGSLSHQRDRTVHDGGACGLGMEILEGTFPGLEVDVHLPPTDRLNLANPVPADLAMNGNTLAGQCSSHRRGTGWRIKVFEAGFFIRAVKRLDHMFVHRKRESSTLYPCNNAFGQCRIVAHGRWWSVLSDKRIRGQTVLSL